MGVCIPSFDAVHLLIEVLLDNEGDILHASSFGTHVVVLNNLKDAEELLEKRARIYSNRLFMPITKM